MIELLDKFNISKPNALSYIDNKLARFQIHPRYKTNLLTRRNGQINVYIDNMTGNTYELTQKKSTMYIIPYDTYNISCKNNEIAISIDKTLKSISIKDNIVIYENYNYAKEEINTQIYNTDDIKNFIKCADEEYFEYINERTKLSSIPYEFTPVKIKSSYLNLLSNFEKELKIDNILPITVVNVKTGKSNPSLAVITYKQNDIDIIEYKSIKKNSGIYEVYSTMLNKIILDKNDIKKYKRTY